MIKIGALPFINALPFFNPFLEKRVPFSGEIAFGSPTEINSALENGDIDIGLVSSASFLAHRERYILLTNLGIAASKDARNICLFSNIDVKKLNGKKIAVTDAHTTSLMLLKVLCENYWGIKPEFVVESNGSVSELLDRYDAALIVGDGCFISPRNADIQVYDLGRCWYEFCQKPFVLSVFATRIDAWMQWPEEVRDFHQKLVSAYEYSSTNLAETLASAHAKTGLEVDDLKSYYKGLDYYLDSNHFQGLEKFADLNAKRAL